MFMHAQHAYEYNVQIVTIKQAYRMWILILPGEDGSTVTFVFSSTTGL